MLTVEDAPRTTFHPQRTDPPVISASSTPVAILYGGLHALNMSVVESVSNIRSFMHSSSRIAAARDLRGKEAQGLIDLIDQVNGAWLHRDNIRETEHGIQVIALPELDERLRRQCLHLLSKICKACETLPASYILQRELKCVDNIRCYGGFADVSEGEYLGRRVAIKHLRFGTGDAFNGIFKVPNLRPTGWPIVTQFACSGSAGKL